MALASSWTLAIALSSHSVLLFSFLLSHPVPFLTDSIISALLSEPAPPPYCLSSSPLPWCFTVFLLSSVLCFTSSWGHHEWTLAGSPDNVELLIWFGRRGDGLLVSFQEGWPPSLDYTKLTASFEGDIKEIAYSPVILDHCGCLTSYQGCWLHDQYNAPKTYFVTLNFHWFKIQASGFNIYGDDSYILWF